MMDIMAELLSQQLGYEIKIKTTLKDEYKEKQNAEQPILDVAQETHLNPAV